MIHFLVHEPDDGVGVVVVEGVNSGPNSSAGSWKMTVP